jgi:DNA-directed RNA polymerase specialized sigma24 family protein
MSTATHARAGDPQLDRFLCAATDALASAALEALLGGETERVVRDTVRRELSGSRLGAAHADDVMGDVRVRLVRKLWSLRRSTEEPIENFHGYVAITAERACYAFFRQQFPERTRFRNRVRYAVSHHAETTLTRDAHGRWLCGTRAGPRRIVASGAARAFFDDPRGWLAGAGLDDAALGSAGLDIATPLPTLIAGILARFDEAVELDRLVDALAVVFGILQTRQTVVHRAAADAADDVPDTTAGIGEVLEQRDRLLRVWNEIVELPARQRAALLLNLRDPEGGAVLQMLPSTGVVAQPRIAAALGMDLDQLTRVWNRLPLDDLSIAALLRVTRQQVINLRKSARARLARRLRMTEW